MIKVYFCITVSDQITLKVTLKIYKQFLFCKFIVLTITKNKK